ncbi:MAG: S-adenosylmethionine decarboxylase proenzyme [Hyphomicrobiaceae bacterium hypho_1]
MAYDDTLFQLGMDLTRSSTAQKEDHGETTSGSQKTYKRSKTLESQLFDDLPDERLDYFIERNGVRYAGNHLIIDLFGARRIDDIKHMEQTLKQCVKVAGATELHFYLHHFTPNGGISGVAVLSESHISVHSWPEAYYAAFDIFMCGKAKPELCIKILKDAFEAREVIVKTHRRGEDLDLMDWRQATQRVSEEQANKAA